MITNYGNFMIFSFNYNLWNSSPRRIRNDTDTGKGSNCCHRTPRCNRIFLRRSPVLGRITKYMIYTLVKWPRLKLKKSPRIKKTSLVVMVLWSSNTSSSILQVISNNRWKSTCLINRGYLMYWLEYGIYFKNGGFLIFLRVKTSKVLPHDWNKIHIQHPQNYYI